MSYFELFFRFLLVVVAFGIPKICVSYIVKRNAFRKFYAHKGITLGLSYGTLSNITKIIVQYTATWLTLITFNILCSVLTNRSEPIFSTFASCALIMMLLGVLSYLVRSRRLYILSFFAIGNALFQLFDSGKVISDALSGFILDLLIVQFSAKQLILMFVYGYAILTGLEMWRKVAKLIIARTHLDLGDKIITVRLIRYLGYIIALIVFLNISSINSKQITIVSGALSFGVGFGLQKIFANFISGLSIIFEKKIKVNDLIILPGGDCGYVRKIDIRSTIVENFCGEKLIIPNEIFLTEIIKNMTLNSRRHGLSLDFCVQHGTNLSHLEKLCTSVSEGICGAGNVSWRVEDITDYGVLIHMRVWADDIENENGNVWQLKSKVIVGLDEALRANSIVLATRIISRNV